MAGIVVGVDGSATSLRALRWALERARDTGEVVRMISVTSPPAVVGVPGTQWPVERREDVEERVRQMQQRLLTEVDVGDVIVKTEVVFGHAAHELHEAAKSADLLVVGARGLGGFRGLLLGSVSHQCISHAPCPVVVIPMHLTDKAPEAEAPAANG